MSLFDEPRKEKPLPHRLGEDLSVLSIDELKDRVGLLEAEIARLRAAIEGKTASRDAASSFFKA